MSNKNDNKSLFLYTALIFIVAVLLILLSFFGQTNMEKSQPQLNNEDSKPLFGISEKAAFLSEENTALIAENTELKSEIDELKADMEKVKTAYDVMSEKQITNDLLLSANAYYTMDNHEKAKEIINKITYDELSSDQKIIYDNINNSLQ